MNGQAYSFIVLLILIPVLVFLVGFLSISEESGSQRFDKLVADQLSQTTKNIEEDFIRAIETAGRRALVEQVNHVVLHGQPIDNASFRMEELMINGTLYGNISILMFNNTLEDWRQKILNTPIGFDRNISFSDLSITNLDGFHLQASLTLSFNLSHPYAPSRIEKTTRTNVSISVEELEDPLYILNSDGNSNKQILRYPHNGFAIQVLTGTRVGNCSGSVSYGGSGDILLTANASGETGWIGVVGESADVPGVSCYSVDNPGGITELNATLGELNHSSVTLDDATGVWVIPLSDGLQYYNMFSSSGPDFLMRLEGKITSTTNGLESFVWDGLGIPSKPSQSRIDYQYFSNSTITGNTVRSFPSWFKIDPGQADDYNLTTLLE